MLSTDLDEALTRLRIAGTVAHKRAGDTDEGLLRSAADKLRSGASLSSTISTTVADLLTEVAALLEQHPPLNGPRLGDKVRRKGTFAGWLVCTVDWPSRTVSLNYPGDLPMQVRREVSFAEFDADYEAMP